MSSLPPRCLPDIFDAWMEYVEHLPAHKNYKIWGGLFLISAALTRRVWIQADPTMPPLFPNLFVMFAGAPGTGKDMVINRVSDLLEAASEGVEVGKSFYLGEESLSAKGLVDSIASDEAFMNVTYTSRAKKKEGHSFQSLIGLVPEFGVFMPEYNTLLISIMNELYNCKPKFRDRIRTGTAKGSRVEVTKPHLAMLFGTQPDTLTDIFPEQAFKMGFFSRTILVFADQPSRKDIYDEDDTRLPKDDLWQKLVSDVRALVAISGEFYPTREVQKAINTFHKKECDETALHHSRFADYNTRRSFHAQKLALIISASESSAKKITLAHWQRALKMLFAIEKEMPAIFSNLVSSKGFNHTVEELVGGKEGETVSQRELESKLRKNNPPYMIGQILRNMLACGELTPAGKDERGYAVFKIGKHITHGIH